MSAPSPSEVRIQPLASAPHTVVRVPGSKSYTNRALMAAALARGRSHLTGALFSDDTRYMASALNQLGVVVESSEADASFSVVGCAGRLLDVSTSLFVGNAGTAARFLTAAVSSAGGTYQLDGVERMRERPMADLVQALRDMGVSITEQGRSGCFPLLISGRGRPRGAIDVALPGNASSQFISGLLLAAPAFEDEMTVRVQGDLVSKPYLDLTISVMGQFGVEVDAEGYERFHVAAGQRYVGCDYEVEPDASAASYFFAAAAITGGRITVEGLGTETRQGDWRIVDVLEQMGAHVERRPRSTTVAGTGRLRGVEVDMKDLSDVAQTLAVVAPFADSPTRITGIGFIRNKETDRVGNVVRELQRLGISAREEEDGYTVEPGIAQPGLVQTYDDHRMAMSFALFGLVHDGIRIENPGCTAKTFPHFFRVLEELRGA